MAAREAAQVEATGRSVPKADVDAPTAHAPSAPEVDATSPGARLEVDATGRSVPKVDVDAPTAPEVGGTGRSAPFQFTRREAWWSAAGIFVLALFLRAVAAGAISFPVPEDTAYYVAVAQNLLDGHGLVSNAMWSYQTPPFVFPRPAFEIWLPLPTFLAAIPMALLGSTFRAAQVEAVLVGALVPVLAWRLAADVALELHLPAGRARTLALGTGIVGAAYEPLVVHGALPDSTMPFAALALVACLLMARLLREGRAVRDSRPARWLDPPLLALGLVLGLAALDRNEAIWVALTWALLAWLESGRTVRDRLIRIAVPAVVSLAVYAPWAVRDWALFGTPLPGQALGNALMVNGFDIFAYQHPPTLARYLAQGIGPILEAHLEGLRHNLIDVLLLPAFPIGPLGFLALPWTWGPRALRPLLVLSVLLFTTTTLFFPVATVWGTFLHASGPVQVLLLVSCLLALDRAIVRVGRLRGWTRPVAWLGPALAIAVATPLTVVAVSSIGGLASDTHQRYAALETRLAAAGTPLSSNAPVIADFPIWLADSTGVDTLGLPDEPPSSVLDLAHRFGAGLLVVSSEHGIWPDVLASGAPDAACFVPIDLADPTTGRPPPALDGTHAYRIACR